MYQNIAKLIISVSLFKELERIDI